MKMTPRIREETKGYLGKDCFPEKMWTISWEVGHMWKRKNTLSQITKYTFLCSKDQNGQNESGYTDYSIYSTN